MSVDELAVELADFWVSALTEADWDTRLHILDEIHAQLLVDLRSRAEYDALSPRFVGAIIERLGAPPVASSTQAQIYEASNDESHREAAKAWAYRKHGTHVRASAGFVAGDRRRHPREPVDALSELWAHGQSAACRLVDLSLGGARVASVQESTPELGTRIRLAIPARGTQDARVVYRTNAEFGVEFLENSYA